MTLEAVDQEQTWTARHGLDPAPIPVTGYVSPEYYEREIDAMWKRSWVQVGKLLQIPDPGDYFVKELPWASTSVVVIRGRDNVVRAFHNVCSHRCNRVVLEPCGNARLLRCNFHGWVFKTDGSLTTITDEENFLGINKADYGLTPVVSDSWHGFIFINLDPEPAETLREHMGEFWDNYLAGYPFEECTREYSWKAELDCNWKIIRDAFIETYHAATLHNGTFAKAFTSKDNPWSHNLNFRVSGPHVQMSSFANLGYQPKPMEMLAFMLSGAADSVMDKRGRALPEGVNPTGDPNWSADATWLMPSLLLVAFGGFYIEIHHVPVGVDRTIYEVSQCVRPPRNARERWAQEVANSSLQAGLLEDLATMEATHTMMKGRAKKVFMPQDQEFLIRWAHHWEQKFVGPYPEA